MAEVAARCSKCNAELVRRVKHVGDQAITMEFCLRGGDGHTFRAWSRPLGGRERLLGTLPEEKKA